MTKINFLVTAKMSPFDFPIIIPQIFASSFPSAPGVYPFTFGNTGADVTIDRLGNIKDLVVSNDGDLVAKIILNPGVTEIFGTSDFFSEAFFGGSDRIRGSGGDDTLLGYGANDRVVGRGGNDVFLADDGEDSYNGGGGRDTIDFSTYSTAITIDLSNRDFQDIGDPGTDRVRNVENVVGTDAEDSIKGNGRDNWLQGGNGGDTIRGGAGDDTIDSGAGTAFGFSDSLRGGAGDDIFVFKTVSDRVQTQDLGNTIGDFTPGSDKIDLTGWSLETLGLEDEDAAFALDSVILVRLRDKAPDDPPPNALVLREFRTETGEVDIELTGAFRPSFDGGTAIGTYNEPNLGIILADLRLREFDPGTDLLL